MVSMETPVCDFGRPALDFRPPSTDGRILTLADVRGERGLLVMFICNHCPYVKAIRDRLVRDVTELQALGVGSCAIMSNDPADYPEDSFDQMKRIAETHRFPFPYLYDESQDVARRYGAVCTPDFSVITPISSSSIAAASTRAAKSRWRAPSATSSRP